jgi:glycosyltransferase involved in cell wall biosynthesis
MKLTLLSPYHGGSHQAWAEGYQQHSAHHLELLSLPARFWKWRMHGGAVTLARQFLQTNSHPDLLLATDMTDLTTFLALTRPHTAHLPAVLYMHENQLTYPLPADPTTGPMRRQLGERDMHYPFINYASMLAADAILFNSTYHLETLFAALPNFLKHFPEYNELDTIPLLRAKSHVLPVGINLQRFDPYKQPADPTAPPLILWNQRWEYDKNPAAFFHALYAMADEGIPFQVALCGENFRRRPAEFDQATARLGDRIIHAGYAPPDRYAQLLWQATVTLSTAHHEFFGISILEAIYCHTFPILPHRLSYPELLPEPFHLYCLYENAGGLRQRLRHALTHPAEARPLAAQLAHHIGRYNWQTLAPQYDHLLHHLSQTKSPSSIP